MNSKDRLITLWEEELPSFLNCIRAIPEDKAGYTPNPKTRTAKEIVEHIIGHPADIIEAVKDGCMHHRFATPVSNFNTAADEFESDSREVIKKLKKTDETSWDNKIVTFYLFGQEYPDLSLSLRDISWRLFRDMIHHRGQLSTYYRPMGVRNPVVYGVTREIMDEMMASKN